MVLPAASLALHYTPMKRENDMEAPMIATIVTVCVIGIAVLIYAIRKAH